MTAPAPLTLQLFVPGLLRSRLNGSGSRAHWSVLSREGRRWHQQVTACWLAAARPTWDGPATVTFTAYVGRLWDDDNVAAAIKPIRDSAVRAILGSDDGPRCGHRFVYEQVVRPDYRGVLIEVRAR